MPTDMPSVHPEAGSAIVRHTLARTATARCHQCPETWQEAWALVRALQHADALGHVVQAHYEADYLYAPRVKE